MSRHGDPELTRLNYVIWPDESIGPHTRVDIANEAASTIDSLNRQLTDAKRNEESVVAENGELKPLVLKLESELVGLRVDFSGLQHRAKRELAAAVHEAGCDRVRLGAVRVRLHTLEAAARAVRADEHIEWYHDLHPDQALSKLYALVPEVKS